MASYEKCLFSLTLCFFLFLEKVLNEFSAFDYQHILVWSHFPTFRISHDFLFVSWSWSSTKTEWLHAVRTMQQSRRRLASIQLPCLLNTGLIMHTSSRRMEMKEKQSKLNQKQGGVAVTVLCWAPLELRAWVCVCWTIHTWPHDLNTERSRPCQLQK